MGGKQRRRRRRQQSSPSIKSRTMDAQLVTAFMEVTSCESQENAVHCLASRDWNLDDAINLYFSGNAAGGSTEPPPPSGSSTGTDPILIEEDVPTTEEDTYHGDATIDGDYEDDVMEAPPPPCPALGEIVPTGWGDEEAEPGGGAGEAGAGNVDGAIQSAQDAPAAEQDDNISTKGDDGGGGMHRSDGEEDEDEYGGAHNSDEGYDNMSYDEDDDGGYYDSIVEEAGDGGGRPAVQPRAQKESLGELFRPPYELMYDGSFHDAKVEAARADRFLLVNLQASSGAGEFPSQTQNRDLWADELVKNLVQDSFVFFLLQTEDSDAHLDECEKLASFYRLDVDVQLPAVLVVDPITGQLLAQRSGGAGMTPDEFVRFADEYTKSTPSALSLPKFAAATTPPPPVFPAASGWGGDGGEEELAMAWASDAAAPADDDEVGEQEQEILPMDSAAAGGGGDCSEQEPVPVPDDDTTDELPAEMVDDDDDDDDEPMEGEEMYRLRIRFPDGKMVAKEFGCKRRVASLYAFCRSALHGGGGQHSEEKAFRIMRFAGGALEAIRDDDAGTTFEDLGLNFAAVSVVFDA